MAGRITQGPNVNGLNDNFSASFVTATDGKPALAVVNVDGTGVGGALVSSANTPSIQSSATALAANTSRKGWQIQNVGTNPLFVLLGSGASTTVFHAVLKGGTGASDGLGGSFSQTSGVVYQGIITIAGTAPSYVVMEL